MKKFLIPLILLVIALFFVVSDLKAIQRNLPAGASAFTEIIDITASEPTVIPSIWNRSSITVEQASGESETFRFAVGTSTVDLDLPLVEGVSVSFRSSGFIAVQAATSPLKLAVYHVKE